MLPVDAQVIGDVITSSPSPIPAVRKARWRPAVADVTATACAAPTVFAKACSNSPTRGPLVTQPDRRQATTASISASPIDGRESGRNSVRKGLRLRGRPLLWGNADEVKGEHHFVETIGKRLTSAAAAAGGNRERAPASSRSGPGSNGEERH